MELQHTFVVPFSGTLPQPSRHSRTTGLLALPHLSLVQTKAEAKLVAARLKINGEAKTTRIFKRRIPILGARVELWAVLGLN